MPTYTGADAQKGCEEALTKQVEDAYRLATRKCLAEYEKRLRDNGLWVVRGQYELCKYGAVTEALIEPADAALSGTTRLVDPAPDRARVGRSRPMLMTCQSDDHVYGRLIADRAAQQRSEA
ncbi:hypothetical protein AB0G83_10430 [Streptomyces klenkii]|uniref:hypothetical protein n=1 Tax=Streptomyces klenkii TaxID=1420899 RepID=UPI0033BFDC37